MTGRVKLRNYMLHVTNGANANDFCHHHYRLYCPGWALAPSITFKDSRYVCVAATWTVLPSRYRVTIANQVLLTRFHQTLNETLLVTK